MKKSKIIGYLLLVFALYTIVGMVVDDAAYWAAYNYVTIAFSVISGIVLLRQK
ncbi:MAG: hypothetical protein PHT50_03325 [Candidatus Omnitrophica bacterium]|nr:hypothetical protein [Candidatus Omnitrophota bacterium]